MDSELSSSSVFPSVVIEYLRGIAPRLVSVIRLLFGGPGSAEPKHGVVGKLLVGCTAGAPTGKQGVVGALDADVDFGTPVEEH